MAWLDAPFPFFDHVGNPANVTTIKQLDLAQLARTLILTVKDPSNQFEHQRDASVFGTVWGWLERGFGGGWPGERDHAKKKQKARLEEIKGLMNMRKQSARLRDNTLKLFVRRQGVEGMNVWAVGDWRCSATFQNVIPFFLNGWLACLLMVIPGLRIALAATSRVVL